MKPFASSARQPSSQAVFGRGAGHHEDVPDVVRLRRPGPAVRASGRARGGRSPSSADDLACCVRSVDRRVVLDAPDQIARHGRPRARSARTSMWTRRAVCARNTAACPAELPPPTTTTSSPRAELRFHERGAVVDARALELRRGSSSGSLRYSAPVAMMTVRAGTRAPSSICDGVRLALAGQLRRALARRASARRTSAPACRRAPASSCPEMPGRETRGSSRSASWSRPGRRARSPRATRTSSPSEAP